MKPDEAKKLTIPSVLLILTFGIGSLAGCNTMEGVGEDVEDAGQAIDEQAEE